MEPTTTYVGVDWSGAQSPSTQRRTIWMAEIRDGAFRRVRPGFTRDEATAELIRLHGRADSVVVGLDFGFSFPAAALDRLKVRSAPELWQRAAEHGERWMDGTGLGDYPLEDLMDTATALRRTETELAAPVTPRSTIDLRVRTGNVGRQTVRGLPSLQALRTAGFAVWPFDAASDAVALEVYPRVLRRHVVDADRRDPDRKTVCMALDRRDDVPYWAAQLARSEDNAFDAIVAALALAQHYSAGDLPSRGDPYATEGRIWLPADE